jgi:pimeloyl-ACP methyl ester carboxylesterase
MWALFNSPAAMKILMAGKTSAGAWTSMRFLSTSMRYKPAIQPEEFTICPILLSQPAEDRWTPLHLSELFLKRVKKVDVKVVQLENAGHYPLEQPGLQRMGDAIVAFLKDIESSLETCLRCFFFLRIPPPPFLFDNHEALASLNSKLWLLDWICL